MDIHKQLKETELLLMECQQQRDKLQEKLESDDYIHALENELEECQWKYDKALEHIKHVEKRLLETVRLLAAAEQQPQQQDGETGAD